MNLSTVWSALTSANQTNNTFTAVSEGIKSISLQTYLNLNLNAFIHIHCLTFYSHIHRPIKDNISPLHENDGNLFCFGRIRAITNSIVSCKTHKVGTMLAN